METVDYKALYENMQQENEQLRLLIFKMRNASTLTISWPAIRQFCQDNYIVLMVASMLLYYVGNTLINAMMVMRGQKHE